MTWLPSLRRLLSGFTICVVGTILASAAAAQVFDEDFSHWPTDLKINGRVIVDNGVEDFEDWQPVLQRIVRGRSVACFFHESATHENQLRKALKLAVGEEDAVGETSFRRIPWDDIRATMSEFDVVVIQVGPRQIDDVTELRKLKPHLDRFIADSGTIITDATLAEYLGEYVMRRSVDSDVIATEVGLNLLPDCVLSCRDADDDASPEQLLSLLASHPRSVGVALQPATLLMLSGRKITCFGEGHATFCLPGNDRIPAKFQTVTLRRSNRQSPEDYLLDLTQWRREAIDRTIEPFPAVSPQTPLVKNGTLLIVGGGGTPHGLMNEFVERAGGVENARLVYVPCSEDDDVRERQGTVLNWKRMGVRHATYIHTKDRNRANTDEEFLASLQDATGIWFGGGRQWNFSDSYYGTQAHRLMKEVLHRGGVIGGSSAGASIQARYLARATPIGNSRIMAPGYERGGLGFLSGVAIDQHFSQRSRQKDMTQLMSRHPQLLGIGLDESTAIVVQQSTAEVIGQGKVFFYNRRLPVEPDKPDYIALPAGSRYDMAKREVLVDTTEEHGDRQILIVIGPSNHPPGSHEVAAGGRLMQHCLNESKNVSGLTTTVVDAWPESEEILDAADTVVFIGDTFPPNRFPGSETILAKLGTMMNRGCGIVCVHYATGLRAEDVTEDGEHPLLHWMGGYFATRCPHHQSIAKIYPHATITPAAVDHPVSRGWKQFTLHDEPYINNYFGRNDNQLASNVTALATSLLPPENPQREVVAWCVERDDGGRGFGIVMPHFYRSWQIADLRTFILNGIVWTAGRHIPQSGVVSDLPDLKTFEPESVQPIPRE